MRLRRLPAGISERPRGLYPCLPAETAPTKAIGLRSRRTAIALVCRYLQQGWEPSLVSRGGAQAFCQPVCQSPEPRIQCSTVPFRFHTQTLLGPEYFLFFRMPQYLLRVCRVQLMRPLQRDDVVAALHMLAEGRYLNSKS